MPERLPDPARGRPIIGGDGLWAGEDGAQLVKSGRLAGDGSRSVLWVKAPVDEANEGLCRHGQVRLFCRCRRRKGDSSRLNRDRKRAVGVARADDDRARITVSFRGEAADELEVVDDERGAVRGQGGGWVEGDSDVPLMEQMLVEPHAD